MRLIAFKRAGPDKSLHKDFITEYVDSSLIPSTEGYETLPEDLFKVELEKNPELHKAYLKEQEELNKAKMANEEAIKQAKEQEERQMKREFEQFWAWKQSKSKKGNK